MRILKYRIFLDLFIGLCGVLMGLLLTVKMMIGIVSLFVSCGFLWGTIFSIVGILIIVSYISFMCFFFSFLKPHAKMLNLAVFIDNDDLVINKPPSEFRIHKSSIKYVLKSNMATIIVWFCGNSQNQIKTFCVRKQYFLKQDYKDFMRELSTYRCFSDDTETNKKISVELGLNHIFRKNKLEFEF